MELRNKKCVPCEGFTDPLSDAEEDELMQNLNLWKLDRESVHKIERSYTLLHFRDAISFVNKVADLSEDEGHHPNITILYNIVIIEVYTHAIDGLSENDFILAVKIDEIFDEEFKVN